MENKTFLVVYKDNCDRIHRTLAHGRTNVEALVKMFEGSPMTRLTLVSCEEVTDDTDLSGIIVWRAEGRRIVEVRY